MVPDPFGYRDLGNPDFPEFFFWLFFTSTDLLGPQGHPLDGLESPYPDPDREIRFFENPDVSFFQLHDQYLISLMSPRSRSEQRRPEGP